MIRVATTFKDGTIEWEREVFKTLEEANERAKEIGDYFAQFGGITMVVDQFVIMTKIKISILHKSRAQGLCNMEKIKFVQNDESRNAWPARVRTLVLHTRRIVTRTQYRQIF